MDNSDKPEGNALALKHIQNFPQVDTLCMSAFCLENDDTWLALEELLRKQDRPWKFILDLNLEQSLGIPDRRNKWSDLFLLLQCCVPYLALLGSHAQYFDPSLVEKLGSLTALQELDLRSFHLTPNFLALLYERSPTICEKIPHVVLHLQRPPESGASNLDFPTFGFPEFAQHHLRSIKMILHRRSIWPEEALVWVQMACQMLTRLDCLELEIEDWEASDLQPVFDVLSTWMTSSSCRCTKLSLHFLRRVSGTIPDDTAQSFYRAVGNNRTLQALRILGLSIFPQWTDLFENLNSRHNMNSSIYSMTLRLHNRASRNKDTKRGGRDEDYEAWRFLIQWQSRMRSIRLVSVDGFSNRYWKTEWYDEARYVSDLHARWRRGRYDNTAGTRTPSPMITVPHSLWSKALESTDKTTDFNTRNVSLDAMYYLLRMWLSTTTEIPCHEG